MPHNRVSSICLALMLLSGCATHNGKRIDSSQYPMLHHSSSAKQVTWRKYEGPDFDVFYGSFKGIKECGFGFYLGGNPRSNLDPQTSVIQEHLGAFLVDWHQMTPTNSRTHRQAVFDYRTRIHRIQGHEFKNTTQIHVWVFGVNERQVEEITHYISGLQLFQTKPQDEIHEQQ